MSSFTSSPHRLVSQPYIVLVTSNWIPISEERSTTSSLFDAVAYLNCPLFFIFQHIRILESWITSTALITSRSIQIRTSTKSRFLRYFTHSVGSSFAHFLLPINLQTSHHLIPRLLRLRTMPHEKQRVLITFTIRNILQLAPPPLSFPWPMLTVKLVISSVRSLLILKGTVPSY